MADGQHGGYRRPNHPAPVSGPGALSARTDGGPTQAPMLASGGPYGSRQEMQGIQSGAPLQGGGGATTPSAAPPIPFDAPTTNPNEPVTAGAGTVPGMNATQMDDATRERLLTALPVLAWLASQPQASEQTRQFVRQVRADL
ncbi:MAG: hypothetical protein ACXVGN_00060 [Mycobacteriaceae bacterium]